MQNDLLHMRHKLLNTAIFYAVILVFPTLISSISRALNIGWHNIFYFHIGVALAITILYLLRNKLSIQAKAHSYALIFGSISFVGLFTFGLVSGIPYYILTVLLLTIILNKKTGLIYACLFVVLFLFTSIVFTSQITRVKIDLNLYNTESTAWFATLISFIYILLIIINTIGVYNQFFTNNISMLSDTIEKLQLTQNDLIEAKNQAEEREKQLRQISNNFENGMIYQVVATDENTRKFTYLSESVNKFYGCSISDALNDASLIYKSLHPDDRPAIIELEKQSLRQLKVFRTTVRTYQPDGTMRWVYLVSKPRKVNSYVVWDGIEFDITDIKKSQAELEMFKKYIDLAPVGAYWFNKDGYIEYVNETGSSMLGYTQNELYGKNIYEINKDVNLNPERWIRFWEKLKSTNIFKTETSHIRKDGSTYPVEVISSFFEYDNKEYNIGFALDITERKKNAEALQKSEDMYRSLFDNMTSGLIVSETINDSNGKPIDLRIVQVNDKYAKITGQDKVMEVGKTSKQMFTHIPNDLMQHFFDSALTGAAYQYERYNPELDKYLDVQVFSPSRGLVALLFNDITERKKNEKKIQEMITLLEENNQQLKESEEKFYKAFHNNSVAMAISKTDNAEYIVVNNEFLKLVERNEKEVIGQSAINLNLWVDYEHRKEIHEQIAMKGSLQNIEIEIQTKNAKPKTILASMDSLKINNQNCLLVTAIDITPLKKAEIALRENEEHLQYLLNSVTDYIYSSKIENDQVAETKYGEGCKTVTGYSARDFITNNNLWIDIVLPEDMDLVIKQAEKIIKTHVAEPLEHRIITKEGEIKWVRNTPVLRYNLNNELAGYEGLITDITERKLLEQHMLNSVIETEERERQNFSQELHDGLGPLISAIRMYIQLLSLPGSEVKPEAVIGQMEKLIEESSRTIREISFKLSPHILQNYGVIEALSAFIEKVQESKKIVVEFAYNSSDRFSTVIETVIYRVLCECINNTVKHANASKIGINFNFSGSTLEIYYQDNGEGFEVDEVLSSQKGIGLLNMQSRIKSVNGSMSIKSAPGSGTTIVLKILIGQ